MTIWGADGDPLIFDYSWREWGGLIGKYYLKRWQKFYAMLAGCLKNGTSYTEDNLPMVYGREAFRANAFYSELGDWELEFVNTPHKVRMPVTEGDEVEIVKALYSKYLKLAEVYYQNSGEVDYIDRKNTFENFGE